MVGVVVLLPVGDYCAGFVNVIGGIHVQAFIAYATVDGFHVSVAPGLPGWDVMDAEHVFCEFA